MNAQIEPSSVHDGDGKRRALVEDNTLTKRAKLATTKGVGLSVTSADAENDELKAADQPQGEETVHGNMQGIYDDYRHETTSDIAEPLHASADSASSITKSGPLDNPAKETTMTTSTAHGDELVNNKRVYSELKESAETGCADANGTILEDSPDHIDRGLEQECMENRMQYSVFGADNSFTCESDKQQVSSMSPIEGSILADKTQCQSNNTTDIRPIPVSEEEVVHNIPEIQESILASEEKSEETGIQKDGDVDSDATRGNTLSQLRKSTIKSTSTAPQNTASTLQTRIAKNGKNFLWLTPSPTRPKTFALVILSILSFKRATSRLSQKSSRLGGTICRTPLTIVLY